MKKNKKADSIAGIIIAVFILSFAMLGIVNVLDYNKDMTYNYEKETDSYVLKSNSDNILKRLNISELGQDEIFYIRKDNVNNEFLILTGSTNEHYKYVDKNGNNIFDGLNIVDYTDVNGEIIIPEKYIGKTFIREFQKKIDILRHDIKPPEIMNLVFHFDANNIDGNYNQGINSLNPINNGDTISVWRNLANNGVPDAVDKSIIPGFTANYSSSLPTFNDSGLNNLPMVEFNGIDQMLGMNTHPLINTNYTNCSIPPIFYDEKSFAIVFKTGFNITNTQMIYEQGGDAIGYNFMIYDGEVWAGIHNNATFNKNWCPDRISYQWNPFKNRAVYLGDVMPNTIYFIMVVHDSTNRDINGNLIGENNRLKIFLNGNLVREVDNVMPQSEHFHGGIGNIFNRNVNAKTNITIRDHTGFNETAYFEGGIGELISRNHALSENEVRGVQNYFEQKWLGGRQTVRYDIINTNIEEFRNY